MCDRCVSVVMKIFIPFPGDGACNNNMLRMKDLGRGKACW